MRLPRIAVLVMYAGLVLATSAWGQADPLHEANQLFRQGQFDRAMERVNSYLSTRPKDARGRFLKGLVLTEQNKPNEAIKIFTDLSQDFPDLPEPYNNLAVLYASQGQYDKARRALEMAIRTHPSYATAHENLGDIYAKMASQAYDKALQLDRGNQAAQGKLNLIKDLFSQTPRTGAKVAAAKTDVSVATTPAAPTPAAKPAPVAPTPQAVPAAGKPPVEAPASASATVAKPAAEPKDAKAATVARNTDEVMKTVNTWARAWASNDVPGYLAHYSSTFKPPKGMSRSAWEAERKTRIAKPRKIEVDIASPRVTFDDRNQATVSFRQTYKSGSMNNISNKTLVMVKTGDKWLIQQERAGS